MNIFLSFQLFIMETTTQTKANVRLAVPFFRVTDMEKSLRFYIDGLGFSMLEKWVGEGKIRWCWLQLGETAFMLQEFKTEGHNSWVPEGKLGEGVSICYICEDALAIYRDLISRGLQASRPFVGNGMWVTTVFDPDGYRLEFESKTDAAEESLLPET